MKWRWGFLLGGILSLICLTGLFTDPVQAALFSSGRDETLYGVFCQSIPWLCQLRHSDWAALKKNDNWFFMPGEAFRADGNESLYFTFSVAPDNKRLLVVAAGQNGLGWGKIWQKTGEDWRLLSTLGQNPWWVFSNKEALSLDLLATGEEETKVKLQVFPLINEAAYWLKLDQLALQEKSVDVTPTATPTAVPITPTSTPTPTPTLTPTSTPTATPTPITITWQEPSQRRYFNDAVLLGGQVTGAIGEQLILAARSSGNDWEEIYQLDISQQTASWQFDWHPEEAGEYQLRATVADQEQLLPSKVVCDRQSPQLSWRQPRDGQVVDEDISLDYSYSDDISESAVNQTLAWQAVGETTWQTITADRWAVEDLALGYYRLRFTSADQAGNQSRATIEVERGSRIYDVFLVDNVLSWRTKPATRGRVVYDHQSHQSANRDYPNLGYAWASPLLETKKQYSHQFTLPDVPEGQYYYRIIAVGSHLTYSAEFNWQTDQILGAKTHSSAVVTLASPSPTATNSATGSVKGQSDKSVWSGLSTRRLIVLVILALLASGTVVYLTSQYN